MKTHVRNSAYLRKRLSLVWHTYFEDIRALNMVHIRFGRKCFKRLGSIRRTNITEEGFDTLILLNGHFKNEQIPEFVIDATIAHELAHYVHGISSPHPRLYKYPHRGGVIEKEVEKRELTKLIETEDRWLKSHWRSIAQKSYNQNEKDPAIAPVA